jgi:N-methylhydantoinase A
MSVTADVATSTLRVAVDVGGTFTDVCVFHEATGAIEVAKVPSTPDPIHGVIAGIGAAGVDLDQVGLFCHGTTVATNALITRDFPAAAMVTTRGFRDVVEIRRGTKPDLWDAYKDVGRPYVPRRHRLEVTERMDHAGRVVEPLDEDAARDVARIIGLRGIETVAVCFINAHANPANELRMAEILAEELPDCRITTSSEVLPEIFEYERFSTTLANAVLSPKVSGYVSRLRTELEDGGYRGDLLILHSGGGVVTPRTVDRLAVRLAASGIAAGAIATRHIAALGGHRNAIGLDMGGTSTDISLVVDGETRVTHQWSVEYGYPICFPSIEVLTIGAGGGSLAWLDEAGSLRNGPQSAGSVPGPAGYGRGGTIPTNTDANLVLGRLGDELASGAMTLDRDAALEAVRTHIADPLGMAPVAAARAIVRVANANMADAVRLISIRRGYDPRDFALVVFGGAGPLHGIELARELSIPTVLVPPNPGITSALGCLLVDVRHDLSTMFIAGTSEVDPADAEAAFARLEEEARERLAAEHVPDERVSLHRFVDMRYVGQWRAMSIAVDGPIVSLDEAVARFHDEHEREHNYRRDDAPVEIYRLGVRAIGAMDKPELARHELTDAPLPAPVAYRRVLFDEQDEPIATPIYARDALHPGAVLAGPAVLEQLDSTIPLPPGVTARVDEWHTIHVSV